MRGPRFTAAGPFVFVRLRKALAAGVGVVLSRELFGVSGPDPVSHGGAPLLFAIVASLVAAPSVRRAPRVDPIAALRHD